MSSERRKPSQHSPDGRSGDPSQDDEPGSARPVAHTPYGHTSIPLPPRKVSSWIRLFPAKEETFSIFDAHTFLIYQVNSYNNINNKFGTLLSHRDLNNCNPEHTVLGTLITPVVIYPLSLDPG
jgi:hypothetical protein